MRKQIRSFIKENKALIKEHFVETYQTYFRFFKYKLFFVIELLLLTFILEYIKPATDRLYLGGYTSQNVDFFEIDHTFWISFITIIIYIPIRDFPAVFSKVIRGKYSFKNMLYSTLIAILVSFPVSLFFRETGKAPAYYLNSFYTKETSIQVFKIYKIHANRVKLIHDEFGKLNSRKYVDIIDQLRIQKNQQSVYDLESGDTIKVKFYKGFFDELYVKGQ